MTCLLQATLGLWARAEDAEERLDAQKFELPRANSAATRAHRDKALASISTLQQKMRQLKMQKQKQQAPSGERASDENEQQHRGASDCSHRKAPCASAACLWPSCCSALPADSACCCLCQLEPVSAQQCGCLDCRQVQAAKQL